MRTTFFVLLVLLLIVGCSQQAPVQSQSPLQSGNQPAPPASADSGGGASHTVEITSAGFSPSTLTIKAGDIVRWVNKDTVGHWPASANHPTHNVYPEPGGCIGSKFDACKALAPGESWSFTFDKVGDWAYHDHINFRAPFFGNIVVQ